MRKFELKLLDGKLVIDLNSVPDLNTSVGMVVKAYDGASSHYDICDLGPAPVVGTVELSDEMVAKIEQEYQDGGECSYCGETVDKLRDTPLVNDVGYMCRSCWNDTNRDRPDDFGGIGKFDEEDELCTHCSASVPPTDQHGIDDETMFCPECVTLHEE